MSNGIITILADDRCPDCGEALRDHDRERVREADGRWSYDYTCLDGGDADV